MLAHASSRDASAVLRDLSKLLPGLEALYKDIHAHPELSMQERRTAGIAAERLGNAGYEVTTEVGGTGVVGLLRNGEGPTVMLRADMDALPIAEAFRGHFSAERVKHTEPAPASEDFGCFATAWQVPSVFWFAGGNDPRNYAEMKAGGRLNEIPVNHSPKFAPVLHPTLETGVEALVVGALAWFGARAS